MSEFAVSKRALEWVAKALAPKGFHRPVLELATVAVWRGRPWLVATDTHRLHTARLSEESSPESPGVLVDLRRIVAEIAFHGSEEAVLAPWERAPVIVRRHGGGDPFQVAADCYPDLGPSNRYPNFARVIPDATRFDGDAPLCLNVGYVADAMGMSGPNGAALLRDGGAGASGSVLFVDNSKDPAWLALVSPILVPFFERWES